MKAFRGLLIALVVSIFLLPSSNASAATFSDVTNYKSEISYLVDRDILNGYKDGTFKPNNNMNRLNGVQVLLKAKGITDFTAPNPNFMDMNPTSYGYAEVAKAVQLGIISGKKNPDGSSYFDPKGQLTRGQMAKIIVETMDYSIDNSNSYRDLPKSNGFFGYVSTLAANRITEGYADLTFRASVPVSRQHFSVFVARMLNDKFKPAKKPVSYLMDPKMDYTRLVKDGNKTVTSKLHFIGYDKIIKADGWHVKEGSEEDTFYTWEDKNGLYLGYMDSYYHVYLEYPLYNGKKFSDGWFDTQTIVSVDRTVTTKAGTFYNVVEVVSPNGHKSYYAKNVGVIKAVNKDGKNVMELASITPRR